MSAYDLWLDPPDDDEPEPLDDDAEPNPDLEPDGDWGSDEIDRTRDQRYDR
jgi:hypothetical protein